MAGRDKIKCYSYDNDGNYLRSYNSLAEARDVYHSDILGKVPMFPNNEEYMIMPNGDFLSRYRIGKLKLLKLERIRKCPYCSYNKSIDKNEIEVFNLKGEKIAEFKNAHIASKLLNINRSTLWARINSTTNIPSRDNLFFKVKA